MEFFVLLVASFIWTAAPISNVNDLEGNAAQINATQPKIINANSLFTSRTNIPFQIAFQIISDPKVTHAEFRHYYVNMKIQNSTNFRTSVYTSPITLSLNGKTISYYGIIAKLKVSNFSGNFRGIFVLKVTNPYGAIVHLFKLMVQEDSTSSMEKEKLFITIVTVTVAMVILLVTTVFFIALKITRVQNTERSLQQAHNGLAISPFQVTIQETNNDSNYQSLCIMERSSSSADYSTLESEGAHELSTFSTLHSESRDALERLPPGVYGNSENKGVQQLNAHELCYQDPGIAAMSSLQADATPEKNMNSLRYQFLDLDETSQAGDYDIIRTEGLPEFNTFTNVHSRSWEYIRKLSTGDYNNLEAEDLQEQNNENLHYQHLNTKEISPAGNYDILQFEGLTEVRTFSNSHCQPMNVPGKMSSEDSETLHTEDWQDVNAEALRNRFSDLTQRSLSGNYDSIDSRGEVR